MAPFRHLSLITAGALVALAVAVPLHAQGKSQGKGKKSSPPSSSPLPSPVAGPAVGASPIAWLDDASLLQPGSMALTFSAMRWSGADLTEVDLPIFDAAVGLTRRFQMGVSVPHIVAGPDGTAPIGGVGTSYITSKIAILTGADGVKLAVSPVVEILGAGAAQALAPGQSRAQLGLPVSLEVGQGPARVFASTGVFTRGAWFAGGGFGYQVTPRVAASTSFTRSWAKTDTAGVSRDRRELSGGVSYFLRPQVGVFGSLGRTIATADENGAGTTLSFGVSLTIPHVVVTQ